MIQRKAHNRHAPIPTNYEPEVKRQSYTVKHVEEKPLKLSAYWMDVYHATFKSWHK